MICKGRAYKNRVVLEIPKENMILFNSDFFYIEFEIKKLEIRERWK
jgi:hypothetical protein